MGILKDGTIVPTPRDRVLSSEEQDYLEALLQKDILEFEVFYSDLSSVRGRNIPQWKNAPDSDVQLLVVKYRLGGWAIVNFLDTYTLWGISKTGAWMDDTEFYRLNQDVHSLSRIIR